KHPYSGLRHQMLEKRILSTIALTTVLAIAPADGKEEPATPRKPYLGTFATSVLAGRSTNELTVPVSPEDLQLLPENDPQRIAIHWPDWNKEKDTWRCRRQLDTPKVSENITIRGKEPVKDYITRTRLLIDVPPPPCIWPPIQTAHVTIKANIDNSSELK